MSLQAINELYLDRLYHIWKLIQLNFSRYMGTMAGAVHSGQRAAIEVLNILRPQSLTSKDYHLLTEINQKYEDEPKPVASWNINKWTIILPTIGTVLAWTAFRLRATYSQLLVPKL